MMAEPLFDVWFEGVVLPGYAAEDVKRELALIFKAEPSRIEALFGARSAIKRNVDAATARRYQLVLAKAGAGVEVVPAAATTLDASEGSPTSPAALSLAEPGVTLIDAPAVPAPHFDLTAYSLAEPGVMLVDPVPTPEPEFDLSGLTLLPLDAPDYTAPTVREVREFETRGLSLMEISPSHE
jgi:hypothetical protein